MSKTFAFAATLAAATMVAGLAIAQPADGGCGHGAGMGGMGGRMQQGMGGTGGCGAGRGAGPGNPDAPGLARFAAVDADQDGVVSAEEAAAAVELVYVAMDADDDGRLTREEYRAVRMGPQTGTNAARQAERQNAKAARFDAMDGDHDGTVSRAEFLDGGKARFEAADTDRDGKVTPWEFRRQHRG